MGWRKFKVYVPDDGHLAQPHGEDNAYLGAILDDLNNQIQAQARLIPDDDDDGDDTADVPNDPDDDGPAVLALALVATFVLGVVAKTVYDHREGIGRWFDKHVRPGVRRILDRLPLRKPKKPTENMEPEPVESIPDGVSDMEGFVSQARELPGRVEDALRDYRAKPKDGDRQDALLLAAWYAMNLAEAIRRLSANGDRLSPEDVEGLRQARDILTGPDAIEALQMAFARHSKDVESGAAGNDAAAHLLRARLESGRNPLDVDTLRAALRPEPYRAMLNPPSVRNPGDGRDGDGTGQSTPPCR